MENRIIKFRAWDVTTKIMRNGVDIKNGAQGARACYATPNSFLIFYTPLGDEVIMQFTGLHDKNGKEIYEGDIVWIRKRGTNQDRDYLCAVNWNQQGACFHFSSGKYFIEPISLAQSGDGENVWCDNLWYAGNIYESPELLKTKQQS